MAAAAVVQSLLVLIFLLLGCLSGFSYAEERVVGGYSIDISQVPYQVYMLHRGTFHCGGALIKHNWVLTAAHCVHNMDPRNFRVFAGSTYVNRGGQSSPVSRIFIPSNYNPNGHHMDIALMLLPKPLVGNNIKTIPLARTPVAIGAKARVTGWGATSFGGSTSLTLQALELPVLSTAQCHGAMKGRYPLTNSMLCVGDGTFKSSCNGDSGGPLTYGGYLHGVVSWGVGCSTRDVPAVFTDVFQALPFIEGTIAQYP